MIRMLRVATKKRAYVLERWKRTVSVPIASTPIWDFAAPPVQWANRGASHQRASLMNEGDVPKPCVWKLKSTTAAGIACPSVEETKGRVNMTVVAGTSGAGAAN